MKSIHSASVAIIFCFATARLSSLTVGAFTASFTATRAISTKKGPKIKIDTAIFKDSAADVTSKLSPGTAAATKEKSASKPTAKVKQPVAKKTAVKDKPKDNQFKGVTIKIDAGALASFTSKLSPSIDVANKKGPLSKPVPKKKQAVKKAVAKAKPNVSKPVPKKKQAAKKVVAKAKPNVSKAVLKKKQAAKKVVAKAKPNVSKPVLKKKQGAKKAVVKAKPSVSKPVPKKKQVVMKAAAKAKPKAKLSPTKKKTNPKKKAFKTSALNSKLAPNIANNLIKVVAAKKKPGVKKTTSKAKPKSKVTTSMNNVLNPITFGFKVVQSKEGQDAAGDLISGGLKLVSATLEEGKNSKVAVPRGINPRTGELKTEVVSVGPKELIDAGIFAGTELVQAAGSVYNQLYVSGVAQPQSKVKKTPVKISTTDTADGVLNPITFGLKVVQSKGGQEAAGDLINGGLKLVGATLGEGKNSKVAVPRGFDLRTGQVKTRAVSVGPKELIDVGLFAGTEVFDAGKSVYERLYVTGDAGDAGKDTESESMVTPKAQVTTIAARVDDKTGKLLAPEKEMFFVNVGGKRVQVTRPQQKFLF